MVRRTRTSGQSRGEVDDHLLSVLHYATLHVHSKDTPVMEYNGGYTFFVHSSEVLMITLILHALIRYGMMTP